MTAKDDSFAASIKTLRKTMGLTQQEMADIIGVRKTTVCNYESGYATPTIATLKIIMSKFNLPATYFIPDSDLGIKKSQILYGTTIPFYLPTNIEGLCTANKGLMDSPLTIPTHIGLPKRGCIATYATDNSMNRYGIKRSSAVIIDTTKNPKDNSIFAAICNQKLIIRKYHSDTRGIYMTNESTKIPSGLSREEIPEDNFTFLGIITKIISDI